MKTLCVLSIALLSTGCFHWVPDGRHGMAEVYPVVQDSQHTLYQQNAQALIAYQHQLQQLATQGGDAFAPAALHQARLQWIRATREHGNQLNTAVSQQLKVLQQQITAIKVQMDQQPPTVGQLERSLNL